MKFVLACATGALEKASDGSHLWPGPPQWVVRLHPLVPLRPHKIGTGLTQTTANITREILHKRRNCINTCCSFYALGDGTRHMLELTLGDGWIYEFIHFFTITVELLLYVLSLSFSHCLNSFIYLFIHSFNHC